MKGKHPLQKATRHVTPSSTPSLPRLHNRSRKLPIHASKSQEPLTHLPQSQKPPSHPQKSFHPLKPKPPRTLPKPSTKSTMPKPPSRKKAPRYLRSRNWRDRSSSSSSSSSFSEDSIQRQLNYLVPRHEEPGCCWHACGWEGFVWCCGWTCWAHDEGGVQEEEDGGVSVEGEAEVVMEKEQEKKVDRPLRALYRDEWACDFCGPECFCEWVFGGR